MNKPVLFRFDGTQLALGDRLGRGGEGEVYALANDNARAVKVYSGNGARERQEKILAMVAARLSELTTLAAFPIDPVRKRNGEFAGFIMRKVSGHKPLFELYSPGARKSSFPQANYPFLVRTASNFSKAIGAVHASGCVIGDINPSGIFIADDARVTLIDADSFQLSQGAKRFLCKVGVPDYTPPELQSMSLDGTVRTTNHDNFGLAIVVFQLLFMGRHPFSGSYSKGEMPIEKAIREFRFAYGKRPVGMVPPPGAPLFKHFPPALGGAFEAAFGPAASRPSAKDWIGLLDQLTRGLKGCRDNSLHHYWQGSPECPWCRMERTQGIMLFLPPFKAASPSAPSPSSISFNLEAVWRAIEAIAPPGACPPTPRLHDISPEPSAEARRLRAEAWKQKGLGAGAVALAGAILLASPGLWIFYIPAGWFGLARLFGSAGDVGGLKSQRSNLDRQWTKALGDWQNRCGNEPFSKLKADLYKDKQAYQGLSAELNQRLQSYQQNRRTTQLEAFLNGFYIRRAQIPGIGPAKTSTLASYGFATAADITTPHRIEQVPGFGPSNAYKLIAWRRRLEAQFAYNPNPNQADQVQLNNIKSDISRKEVSLRQKLADGQAALTRAAQQALSLRQVPDAQLQKLHEQKLQLDADIKHVHGSFSAPIGWAAAIFAIIAVLVAIGSWTPTAPVVQTSNTSTSLTPPVPNGFAPVDASDEGTGPDQVTPEEESAASSHYAVRETNVRFRASTSTPIIGKLPRGAQVMGVEVTPEGETKKWLKITSGPYKGYYASAEWNLSLNERPALDTSATGQRIILESISALREPDPDAETVKELVAGTPVTLIGLTPDGYAEVSLKGGTIVYVPPSFLSDPASTYENPSTGVDDGPGVPLGQAVTAPIPHQALASLITADDYPASALYARQEGKVRVSIDVDERGGVSDCTMIVSSGFPLLDNATCRLMRARAKFAPAQDASGNPAPSATTVTIYWTLPRLD
ncbi:TonB family protein [Sphingomonas humi]|uniref:Protein kinase domain-containing protein n=1 Tax=Sphingomonas humi TaxID=335630 RepID=A0ABP7RXK7_9SPHN